MEYLAILILVFAVFWIMKLKYKIQLFKSVKEASLFAVTCLAIGGVWDSYAILRGHWSFGEQFFAGIRIGVIPIEEYLFMLVIPFSVLVPYKVATEK